MPRKPAHAVADELPALSEDEALLLEEWREYRRVMEAYTQDLFRREARVTRLEAAVIAAHERLAELRPDEPFVTVNPMPYAAPLPRTEHGRRLPPGDPLARLGNLKLWAVKHGVSYSSVKRWKTLKKKGEKPNSRPSSQIPMRWALVLLKEYGVPLSYWPNGIFSPK